VKGEEMSLPVGLRWLGLFLALLASGCGTLKENQRLMDFDQSVRGYGAALRWGYYDTAASFVRARPGEPAPPGCTPRSDVRVMAFQARDQVVSPDFSEARVRAVISYVLVDSGSLREASEAQTWWYNADARRWLVAEGLPRVLCTAAAVSAPP
jgi:hypothetical protein